MKYRNPILAEIYAEINLASSGLGDSFINIVPELKVLDLSHVELAPIRHFNITAFGPEDPKITRAQVPRVRVWSTDKKRLVQLSTNQLAVNLVGTYPGWEQFAKLFGDLFDLVSKKAKIQAESVSLGTIDKTLVPSTDFTMGKYLNTDGKIIPGFYKDCASSADLIMGKGVVKNDGMNRQVILKTQPKGTHFEIMIQSTFHNMLKPTESIKETLEKLHKESSASFESMITEKMRTEIMGVTI